MSESPTPPNDDEFRNFIDKFLSEHASDNNDSGLPQIPVDQQALSHLFQHLRANLFSSPEHLNKVLVSQHAQTEIGQTSSLVTAEQSEIFFEALRIAELWLTESTNIATSNTQARLMTRTQWMEHSIETWINFANPIAARMCQSFTDVISQNVPEEMRSLVGETTDIVRSLTSTLFSVQLGSVIGRLSKEVLSGGDIGICVLNTQEPVLLPQNIEDLASGLEIQSDQIALYFAVRELAHAQLFRHAKWLQRQLLTQIASYAADIRIDIQRMETLAESFDPSHPENITQAMTSGNLIHEKNEEQQKALERIETILALIEGWVDTVTTHAVSRLPQANAIAETVRRRRASGGPAEAAFSTLIGLELRPRRMREAAHFWETITQELGIETRDNIWAHPDLLPRSQDIDNPEHFIAQLRAHQEGVIVQDDLDKALQELLGQESPTGDAATKDDSRHQDNESNTPDVD